MLGVVHGAHHLADPARKPFDPLQAPPSGMMLKIM
jgi:hypothetical protein